jgi:1A family penicillin-binding protein
MPERPFDSLPPDEADIAQAPAYDPPPVPQGSRTAAAGRAFLAALTDDLAALGRRLARSFRALTERKSQSSAPTTRHGASVRVLIGFARAIAVLAVLGLVIFVGAMVWALHDLPPERPVAEGSAPALILEASNGSSLGRVGPLRMPDATRKDFPDVLVKAVISIEDRHFYSHRGFDPQGIVRALHRNIAAGTVLEGGSTITQQLVKLRILGRERTFTRKLREALVAMWVDMHRGKDAILTEYLNSVYLGNGVYGMSAAARLYFDKRPAELTLPEAAMLAGMIQSPSRTNPLQNLEAAQARAALVFDAMCDTGAIDAKTAEDAKAHPATPHLSEAALRAGSYFADWIASEAAGVTGSDSVSMRLRTTLDPGLQQIAEQAVADVLGAEAPRRHASQAALVAMRPDGAVLAMVGGRDYQASQFNRAVNAQRQPGSAFKLFVYFAALRNGMTLDDTVDARALEIKGWEPENYADKHYGRVPLTQAFAESINTAAVRLAQQVGLKQVIAAARDLGIASPLPAVPSLPLGTADVNLLELTAAYGAVAVGKTPLKPWGIAGLGIEGQSRLQSMGAPIVETRPLQPYQQPLIELLEEVVRHGTGRSAALDGFSAGKTGTAQDYRDAWFIGFNDDLIVGVWVGNDDHSPMERVTGGSLPAAIWKRFMTAATNVVAREEPPAEATAEAPPQQPAPATPAPKQAATPAPKQAAAPALSGRCDYQACARKYQSFRASDCTYQPYGYSERQACDMSSSQRTADFLFAPRARSAPSRDEPSRGQCNAAACSATYESFDPGTCTYQPYDGGPRRVCTK